MAIRIKAGLVPMADDQPELIPNGVRDMIAWMQGIEFEVLESHNVALNTGFDAMFTIRCRPR